MNCGEADARTKDWGKAVKKFYSVQKHFTDYLEDMFNFHGFCVRKTSLRAHSDCLSMHNTIYANPFYQRAYRGALHILLHLLDEPNDLDAMEALFNFIDCQCFTSAEEWNCRLSAISSGFLCGYR